MERLGVLRARIVGVGILVPRTSFIEHRVTRDVRAPSAWVIEPVRLAARLISDEHHRGAPIVEFLLVTTGHLDMGNTAKSTEEMYRRLSTIPSFVWCHALDAPCWRSVQDEDRRQHRLSPKPAGHTHRLEHAPRHAKHGLVAPCPKYSNIIYVQPVSPESGGIGSAILIRLVKVSTWTPSQRHTLHHIALVCSSTQFSLSIDVSDHVLG